MAKTKRRQLAALAAQAELRELAALKERIAACKKANVPGVYRLDNPHVEIRTQRVIFKIPALPSKPNPSVPESQQQKSTEEGKGGVEGVGGNSGNRTKTLAVKRKPKQQQQKEREVASNEIVVAKRGKKRRQKEPAGEVDVPADETKLSKGILQFGRWKRRKRIADLLPASRPVGTTDPPSQTIPNPQVAKVIQQREIGGKRLEDVAENLPLPSSRTSIVKTYKRKVKFALGSSRKRKRQLQEFPFKTQAQDGVGLSPTPLQKGKPPEEIAGRPIIEETPQAVSENDRNGHEGADRLAHTIDVGRKRNFEAVSKVMASQDRKGAQEAKESSVGARVGEGANNPPARSLQISRKGRGRNRRGASRRRKGVSALDQTGTHESKESNVGAENREGVSNRRARSLQSLRNGRLGHGRNEPPRRRIRIKYPALLSQPRPRTRAQVSKMQALATAARVADALEDALDQQQTEGTGTTIAAHDLRQVENATRGTAVNGRGFESQEEPRIGGRTIQLAIPEAEEAEHADILQNIKNRSKELSEADRNSTRPKSREYQMVKLQNGGGTVLSIDPKKDLGQAAAHIFSGKKITVLRVADRMKQESQVAIMKRRLEDAGGLTNWLLDKGLAQFLPLFEGRINVYVFLLQLTMEGLKSMGFIPVGPRRKLIHAAGALIVPSIPRSIGSNF